MAGNEVLIVGAGPTGMTAAIELKRAGMQPRIVDKSDHMARYSQALVVQARTLEQFQRYGIADEMMAHGRKLHEAKFYSDGKLIVDFKLDGLESPYPFALFIPQSETEKVLNDFMESLGVKTERCVELVSLRQDAQPRATLRHPDGGTEEISPRWVLGCDGAHSAVREKTGTAFEGGGVGLSFYLGDCEVEGEDLPQDELSLHVRHGDVLFMARLSDRVVRLIAALHEEGANSKAEITVEDLQGIVDRIGVRIKIKSGEWLTPFHVNDRQAKHYRIGDVFLAGDASHIHSPVGGQGMNTGIQDAANLCWKLAAVARGADDSLLDSYEEERGEVGKALLRFTKRGLKLASTANPVVERVRDALAPIVTKLSTVQHNAVGFVSETAIEYRSSSAVRDYGGDGHLRAGDRVPDLPLRNPNGRTSILGDWTSPKHRVIALNLDTDDIETLVRSVPDAEVVPLKTEDLDREGKRLFGDDGKLFMLRPDGYLGFRAPMGFNVELMNYARQYGVV
jgi:2-polyprenyl-6-methoxyphenol hydroxylase-like FAD-dependent oxidoreductase